MNDWDNIKRIVERGYAGLSLWEWGTLPEYKYPRNTDCARLNASLGINGTPINNVNANPEFLTAQFLKKTAVLADIFRPFQTFSGQPIPDGFEEPEHDLDYYMEQEHIIYVPDPLYN